LANYRKELDLPIFRTIDDLILYLKQKKIGFLTRYYSEQLNEPKNKIKKIKDSIASLESAKNKLAQKENALSNEKDDTKKEKL
jgi:gas vesicle protein